ncbi:MAG: ATP-binding protein [Clostridia bacterium]|nr:ATP-binding protein [Clostridia bacterium]
MGCFLNPKNLLFKGWRESLVYVDKTNFIKYTNSVIGKFGEYICVSRPRRFGKSVTADMLTAYYGRGCDTHDLFDDLNIASADTYEQHINKYNVIHIVMKEFMSSTSSVDGMIALIRDELCRDIKMDYKGIDTDGRSLNFILRDVYHLTNKPFVFIIDEWDCVIRYHKDDKCSQDKYLEFLELLIKDRPYMALAYLTGILPVKKNGKQSSINMCDEFSMIKQEKDYKACTEEICGFTEDEVKSLCEKWGRDYNEAKGRYYGYNIGGVSVYNPRSVSCFIQSGIATDFWTGTESYEALEQYIQTDAFEIQKNIVKLLSGESVEMEPQGFENDLVTFKSLSNVLTLLVHLGYLTYDASTKTVRIPNTELNEQFRNTIENLRWDSIATALRDSKNLLKATYAGDVDTVARLLDAAHDENTSLLEYNDENSLACVLIIAYYAAHEDYEMKRELAGGKGFADIAYVPKRNRNVPAIVVELKYSKTADAAIDQIRKKNYTAGLAGYSGDVILVGISYDKATKSHTCVIDKVVK